MTGIFSSQAAGIIGLLFFFSFFVLLIFWLLRPGAGEQAKKHARIPLDEEKL
jgi:cbb3-type cytochrome oxidase subunit 3